MRKHGYARRGLKSREYRAWERMLTRCYNPNRKHFKYYGGRVPPITVCERWRHSFENFFVDMGACPPGLTLERKENTGNYGPENCRWATKKEQACNRRSNRRLTFNQETLTVTQWAKRIGMAPMSFRNRLRRGWSIRRMLTTKPKKWSREKSTALS